MGVNMSKFCASGPSVVEEVTFAAPATRHEVFQLLGEKYLPPLDTLRLRRTGTELRDVLKPGVACLAMPEGLEPTAQAALRRMLPTLSNMTEAHAAVAAVRAIPQGYVRLEPGTFTMGTLACRDGRFGGNMPHTVSLSRPFLLKQTPVTQGEFEMRMGFNPSSFSGRGLAYRRPVEQVTYFQALAYCNALSVHEGLPPTYDLGEWNGRERYPGLNTVTMVGDGTGYRLPTEAEWEYAARAAPAGARHGAPDTSVRHANYVGGYSDPVGMKKANAWDLHDMLGNVWEWVADWHGALTPDAQYDPMGAERGRFRVIRGGLVHGSPDAASASERNYLFPDFTNWDTGFRAARTVVSLSSDVR